MLVQIGKPLVDLGRPPVGSLDESREPLVQIGRPLVALGRPPVGSLDEGRESLVEFGETDSPRRAAGSYFR